MSPGVPSISPGLGLLLLPGLLPEARKGRHVPRAGTLSSSHCQDMCLDLCLSFGALLAFTRGPEKMWHFLQVRAPAPSCAAGLVGNSEGAACLPVLVLCFPGRDLGKHRGQGEAQRGLVTPPKWRRDAEAQRAALASVSNTLHPCCCPFMSRATRHVAWEPREPDRVLLQELLCSGEDAASFHPIYTSYSSPSLLHLP